ncbi:tyrosine-type recombinase/integrase, partial [Shewanella sp. SG41-4]|uniref:tyrosine-type recombinase/integrase n=1 Tax=Shewanella sp. SG41-4 TaxID=2760976 RepID=UPI0016022737
MNKYSSLNVRKSEVDMGNGKIKFKLFNLITMSYVLEYEFYINSLVDAGSPYQTVSAKAQDLSRFYDFLLTASQVLVDKPHTNTILSPLVKIFSAFPQFLAFGVHAQDDLSSSVAEILCSPPLKSATVRRVLSTVKIYTVESARIESSLRALRPDNLLNVFSNEVFAKQLLERRNLRSSDRNRLVAQSFLAGCISGGAQTTSSSIFKVTKIISRIDLSNFGSKSFPIAHTVSFCSGIKSLRDKCLYALLFGGGLRMHEALKLKVENIDFANETVRLSNIEAIDFVKMNYKHHRNKGVNHYEVFMIEPFKSFFFDAAEAYWKHERASYTSEFFFLMSSRFDNQPMFTM